MSRGHVVHNVHRDGAARRAVIHVRHGHGKIVGHLLVRSLGIVLQGVAGQLVGKLQLARGRVEARHGQRAFIRGYGVSGKRAVFKHGHAVNSDVLHAVGRIDGQRTFGRGGRSGLPCLRAVRKTGFMHRQRLGTGFGVTRRHHNAVVLAIYGDGHLARGHVAVGVGVGVGDLFRPRVAVGERLHLRVVIVELIAVGAVFVQREFAVPALLLGIRPRKVRTVRAGHRTFKRVAGNGIAVPFRHSVHEALDGGHVVGNHHGHHAGVRGAVAVRHGHGQIVGYLVRALAAVLLRGLRKIIGVVQTPGSRIKARHFQIAFIRGHNLPRKRGAVEHHKAADDDGGHAVGRIHHHVAGSRDGRSVAKSGFIHAEHAAAGRRIGVAVVGIVGIVDDGNVVAEVAGVAGREGHVIVDVPRGRAVGVGIHALAGPADVKAAQTVETVQKVGRHIVVKTVAVALCACGPSGTRGRHEVGLVHGREEVLAGNLGSLHLERGHVLAGIGRVEIDELKRAPVLEGDDEIVSLAGKHGFVGGEIENETRLGSADDVAGSSCGRLGKSYIGHDELLKKRKTARRQR